MKIFVAGASGAVGRPLVAELVRQGHTVTGMTRSSTGATALRQMGASVAHVSALDPVALEGALREARPDVVIDELTALPKDPADMAGAAAGDRHLRWDGGGHLLRLARQLGARRYLQQSSGFFLRPGEGLGDESELLAVHATPGVAASAEMYTQLESRLAAADNIETVALRYGFFYGPEPGTIPRAHRRIRSGGGNCR